MGSRRPSGLNWLIFLFMGDERARSNPCFSRHHSLICQEKTMSSPSDQEILDFINGPVGAAEVFPAASDNNYLITAFHERFGKYFATTEVVLAPGDKFCVNEDGSASKIHPDGTNELFYPEGGAVVVKIGEINE